MSFPWRTGLLALLALIALHGALLLVPGPTFTPAMHGVLFATNAYVLYCALVVVRRDSGARLALFVLGYLILFVLLIVLLERTALFVLLIVAYASVFGSTLLLGVFGLFVLSFVVLQPYAFETFVPLLLIYVVLWRARRDASRFALLCLGGGLLALAVVLLPLLHLIMQDSAQTLFNTLGRSDVQRALWLSVLSSTIATALVALWGVPLAYALARLDFAGKRIVETMIDLPILVPQSVAGVALIVLLGPRSPIGQGLVDVFGVQISGRLFGVVVAQVFVSFPFLVKTAMTAFEGVPVRLEQASRTLGASAASTFWRVSLPLAGRGVGVGAILCWARAISEFGAIVLFASSPVTAPILVHTEFLAAGAEDSRPIASLLLLTCLWIFVVLRFGGPLIPFAWRRALQRETTRSHG